MKEAYTTGDSGPNGEPILIESAPAYGTVLREGSFAQTVGTMAHEFGHRYGLPDLYDRQYAGVYRKYKGPFRGSGQAV